MPKVDPKKNTRVTFAIAADEPVGIVIAAFNSRLSRIYQWDLSTDTFTPGQFLKGRATVETISDDGRLFAYRADAYHKIEQSYSCISRTPFFTALAFFPHHSCTYASIEFQIDGNILVVSEQEDLPWVKGYHLIHERITPGFPGKILRRASQEELDRIHQRHRERQTWLSQSPTEDPRRNRTLFVTGNKILTSTGIPGERKLLAEFLREPFEAIEPPDWAHKW